MIENIIVWVFGGIMFICCLGYLLISIISLKRTKTTANFLTKQLDKASSQGNKDKVEVIIELLNDFLKELEEKK